MKIELPGIIFEATTKCILDCKYCYNHWKINGSCKYLEKCEQISALKTLKKMFSMCKVPRITFSGGEPTLNNELLDLVIESKLRNKRVTIITNGILLDEDAIKQYLKLEVNLFELTINSYSSEVHDEMVGLKGAWEKTSNAIKNLVANNANVVGVVVVTKYNYRDIEKTLAYLQGLGVKSIMINRYNIGGEGVNHPDEIVLKKSILKEVFAKANDFAYKHNIRMNSLVCTPVCILDPNEYLNIYFSNCNPVNLNRQYTLNRNGDIRFCNHSPVVIGNIYQQKLRGILKSNYLKKWSEIKPNYCSDCSSYSECFAGCRAASEQMGKGLEEPDPIIQYS